MRKFLAKQSVKAGLSPGTLVHVGDTPPQTTTVTVVSYDEEHFRETELDTARECPPLAPDLAVTWVHVVGLGHLEFLEHIGECFGLHPLVLEDILNTGQRSKTEDFGEYLFVVGKIAHYDGDNNELSFEQISMIVGPDFVLSFQESAGELAAGVRDRIRGGRGRSRRMGADYLAYALLDAVVDSYFVALEALGEHIEAVEEDLLADPSIQTLQEIHRLRRETILVRKAIWPLRDAIAALQRGASSLVSDALTVFLRDCYDHTVRVMDTVTAFHETLSGMLDLYLSTVSNKMNAVMKVLTIIATLFIPLSFIAGVYGMDFDYMPELQWRWGYPAVLLLMVAVAIGMLVYFRRKDWL
jgi:magnesium transporter